MAVEPLNDGRIALTGTTGKIGGAVLDALLSYGIVPKERLTIITSSSLTDERTARIRSLGITVEQASYDDKAAFRRALNGCETLFLVSTPDIALDFNDAPLGHGREARHFTVIDAAVEAHVRRICYTSLAFASNSHEGVMRAHLRTESYLSQQVEARALQSFTSIREGLYAESWPLYLGHYDVSGADKRTDIVVAGDGKIAWTSIADLGLATASIVASHDSRWTNAVVFLATRKLLNLHTIASSLLCTSLDIKTPEAYIDHYVHERGMDRAFLDWWSSTYPSLALGHCATDDNTLTELLAVHGRTPQTFEDVFHTMLDRRSK